jgi:anti-anti-sigma regulatory factor
MSVRSWSQDIVIVQLPGEPHTSNELETVIGTVYEKPDSDVILDFSRVERVTCLTLCQLTKLHKTLTCLGRRLAFCKVAPITREIFEAIGFDRIFQDAQKAAVVLEASQAAEQGGTIKLQDAENSEQVERRSYFRLDVSKLEAKALIWHKGLENNDNEGLPERYWQGKLLDISQAGAKIAVKVTQILNFQENQFVRLVLTETPIEQTLTLDGKVREVLPSADEKTVHLGLQFVGLEANPDGRKVLQQLCDSMARYYKAPKPAQPAR